MEIEKMKPLVIYHDNCTDGFGAAWAAYKKFGADGAEYLPMNYNDPRVSVTRDELIFPVDVTGRDIYILDFSFPQQVMCALNDACMAAGTTRFVRDHHKTHFEQLGLDPTKLHGDNGDNYDLILDPDKSGCVLAWELFHPWAAAPYILHLIQDRDLWQWKLPQTRNFATGLRSQPFSFDLFEYAETEWPTICGRGEAMNELFDKQLSDITKCPVPAMLQDGAAFFYGLSTNCTPQFSSEAGNTLAKKSETFGMTWCVGENGQVFVSLRSIGDYDVSAIAKAYGGGGHRNAAGFKTSWDKIRFGETAMAIQPAKGRDGK